MARKRENTPYSARIKKVAAQMPENSVLVLIAPASSLRNRDVPYPYRNSSDLLYLTGITEQKFALLVFSDQPAHIYAQGKDPERERWVGPRLGSSKIARALGIADKKAAHNYDDFWNDL